MTYLIVTYDADGNELPIGRVATRQLAERLIAGMPNRWIEECEG